MANLQQKITPCLWFDNDAEEAAKLYTSIFKNSKITHRTYYSEEGFEIHQRPAGSVMTVAFELDGHTFTALNGGPMFKFTEAVSFAVNCDTQDEIDMFWSKLGEGGDPNAQVCGWLKDRFGVSWQIVPRILDELVMSEDKDKANRVMAAMLQMTKMDIAGLLRAAEGVEVES